MVACAAAVRTLQFAPVRRECAVRLLFPIVAMIMAWAQSAVGQHSVARQWDEEALNAIRVDSPRPPIHARNLFHASVAMYDAWAAYDPVARGYLFTEKISPTQDVETARAEAVSYAAFRVLLQRYSASVNGALTRVALTNRMLALGYAPSVTTTVGDSAAAVGNRVAALVLTNAWFDGANQAANYASGYVPINDPLIVKLPGAAMVHPNRWQPLALDYAETQNGIPEPDKIQVAVCPHWGQCRPFALMRLSTSEVYEAKSPPPMLGTASDAQFKQEFLRVVELASYLTPDDGVTIDISPGAMGNNSLGYNDGTGYPLNPVTGQPYAPNIVKRGDFGRVLAEFWADGPSSETPPGHWNVLANYVSDTTTVKRIGGVGPVVGNLEWDVKLYFGLNGALHDAAVAAWNHKGVFDSVRPISAIRFMGGLGQCSDTNQPLYHTNGLPLSTNLVRINPVNPTNIQIRVWPGQPTDPTNQYSGVAWIPATQWVPYQKNTFVTPPFAGFISGHSTYSRSGAEFLTLFTGSAHFPGGMGEFAAPTNYLTFEKGPTTEIRMQWATYFDAADQAGISRLWGGIHIDSDDREGRKTGERIGRNAYAYALQYYAGMATPHPPFELRMTNVVAGQTIAWPTVTGRTYRVQGGASLGAMSTLAGPFTASGLHLSWTNNAQTGAVQFLSVTTGD